MFDKLEIRVNKLLTATPTMRTGQAYWNAAHDLWPDKVILLTGKNGVDPFYDSHNVPEFLYQLGLILDKG